MNNMDNIKEQASIFIYDGGIGFQTDSCTFSIKMEPDVFAKCITGLGECPCEYRFTGLKTNGNIPVNEWFAGAISIHRLTTAGYLDIVRVEVRDKNSRKIFLLAEVALMVFGEMLYRHEQKALYSGAEIEWKNLDKIGMVANNG